MSLDNGYCSDENVELLRGEGIDAYIATGRLKHGEAPPPASRGQIKDARGFQRFLLRGVENVDAEWSIICLAHNLLKLFRSAQAGFSTRS